MTPNNNFSVLPWYASISQQNARRWWIYDKVFPLYTQQGYMLPFQILRTHSSGTSISSFSLYRKNGTFVGNYTSAVSAQTTIKQFSAYDVIVFQGTSAVFGSLAEGQYYGVLSDGTNTWYSDVFTVVQNIGALLKIEWYDSSDFIMDEGAIVYSNPRFVNRLYLPADIAKPEYRFEDESEDRDGYNFPIKQISKKIYHFSFLAPEYLLDVMRFIRMADSVEITNAGQTYIVDSFLMTAEWENNGDVASVDVEFETDTVAKKIPATSSSVFSLSPLTVNVPRTGQTVHFDVYGATDTSYTITATGMTVQNKTYLGFDIVVPANTGEDARELSVIATKDSVTATATIHQEGPDYVKINGTVATLQVPGSIRTPAYGTNNDTFEVETNFPWKWAQTTLYNIPYLEGYSSGQIFNSGDRNINIAVGPNVTGSPRIETQLYIVNSLTNERVAEVDVYTIYGPSDGRISERIQAFKLVMNNRTESGTLSNVLDTYSSVLLRNITYNAGDVEEFSISNPFMGGITRTGSGTTKVFVTFKIENTNLNISGTIKSAKLKINGVLSGEVLNIIQRWQTLITFETESSYIVPSAEWELELSDE